MRRNTSKNGPQPVDVSVGMRVKMRRQMLGMSQKGLGETMGLTFQQVQKYETGINRISASALHRIAVALKVPVGYFFEDADVRDPGALEAEVANATITLVRQIGQLNAEQRAAVRALIRALIDNGRGQQAAE